MDLEYQVDEIGQDHSGSRLCFDGLLRLALFWSDDRKAIAMVSRCARADENSQELYLRHDVRACLFISCASCLLLTRLTFPDRPATAQDCCRPHVRTIDNYNGNQSRLTLILATAEFHLLSEVYSPPRQARLPMGNDQSEASFCSLLAVQRAICKHF